MQKITDAKVKQLFAQAKYDKIQARLKRLRKRIYKSDDNNNNTNSDDSNVDDDDDDDDDDNDGGDELHQRYNILRQPTNIPNDNDELLRRYNNLKALPHNEEELLLDTMTLEHLCFETYHPHHLCH